MLRHNVRKMEEEDWALSPLFLRLIGKSARATEVEMLIQEHLSARAMRKARRLDKATRRGQQVGLDFNAAA